MVNEETQRYLRALDMSKRARAALDVMLSRGAVTTRVLQEEYGLDHPPRAIRDLKDAGALVASRRVRNSGKTISEYYLEDVISGTGGGKPRNPIKKKVRDAIFEANDHRCAVCGVMSKRLQLDHRIPFAIAGDPPEWTPETAMPLCGSDNRAKSWTCEHCPNWVKKDPGMCAGCMWCHPEQYEHIAGEPQRRLVVTATNEEDVAEVQQLEDDAEASGQSVSELAIDAFRRRPKQ